MLFGKKLKRAQDWLREQNPDAVSEETALSGGDLPSMDELKVESRELDLDKSDMFAMIVSAMITIIPACLIVLLVLVGIAYLFFF